MNKAFRDQVIAAILGIVVTAVVGAFFTFVAKLINPDAIIQMLNGVPRSEFNKLEQKIVKLENEINTKVTYADGGGDVGGIMSAHTGQVLDATPGYSANTKMADGHLSNEISHQWKIVFLRHGP